MSQVTVRGPDGQTFRFPQGTSEDVMRQAMMRHYGNERPAASAATPAADTSMDFASAREMSPERRAEFAREVPARRLMPELPVTMRDVQAVGGDLARGARMTRQAAYDIPANIAGLPSDIVVGSQNLVSTGARALGVDIQPVSGSPIGSAALREYSTLGGRFPRLEQDEMAPLERAGFNAVTFFGESALTGGAAAMRFAGRQAAGTLRQRTDNVAQRILDDMGEAYAVTPGRTMAVDAAASAGAAAAMEVSESPLAAVVGAIVGGGAASGALSFNDYLRAQARSRDFPELTRSVASRMVQNIQASATASNPQEAADILARNRTMLERAGIPAPEAAALTMDHGLAVMGGVWRQQNPGRSAQQMADFMAETSRFLQGPIRPSNRFDNLPDADAEGSPLRSVEGYARRRAAELREGAQTRVTQATDNLDQAQNILRNIEAHFTSRAADRQPASVELQGTLRQGIAQRRTERAALYEAARRSPEALTQTVDPTPVRRAFNDLASMTRTAGQADVMALLGADSQVRRHWESVRDLPQAQQRASYNYARVGNSLAELNQRSRQLRDAGQYAEAEVVDQLASAFRAMERKVANSPTPLGAAVRAAEQYQLEEWLPFFARTERGQVGAGLGRDVEQLDLGGRLERRGESFAQNYIFRHVSTDPRETAADLAQLREMTNNPQMFNQAAERYLEASAAHTVGRNGQINREAFNIWLDNHAPVLSLFSDLEQRMYQLGRRVRASDADIAAAQQRLRDAQVGVTRTDADIREGWMNIFLGNSPSNAIRRIFSAGDTPRVAGSIMRDLRASGDPELVRDFQDMTLRYISDRARNLNQPQAALGDEYATSLSRLNSEISKSSGALEEIFRGNPRALQAINDTREMLEMAQYTRVQAAGAQRNRILFPNPVEQALSIAELPLRVLYGHLEAGGKIRSLRLGLNNIPGFNTAEEVDQAILLAFDNPDYLERVLRATPELPPHVRQDVLTRLRLLRAAIMGERENSREEMRANETQE
jgi:hypothetical protein